MSAARVSRLEVTPLAISDSVLIEQGATIMPMVLNDPLEIAAPMSLCRATRLAAKALARNIAPWTATSLAPTAWCAGCYSGGEVRRQSWAAMSKNSDRRCPHRIPVDIDSV
jgi:hypothetical protein